MWLRRYFLEVVKGGIGAGGKGDDRGWDGWMASLARWTWVWVNSGRWWWTERPGVLWFMGLQRVRHDWVTELNWTFKKILIYFYLFIWPHRLLVAALGCPVSAAVCRIFSRSMGTLSCGMWDLVPWPGIEPGPLPWECRVLTTGPPGTSLAMINI